MLMAILTGILAVGAIVAVVVLIALTIKWIKDAVTKRKLENKDHDVVFLDTKEVVDNIAREQLNNSSKISMSELEKLEETPYIMVDMDEQTEEISNVEGISTNQIDSNLASKLNERDGVLIF